MIILSIDPGYERLGVAVIEKLSRGKEVLKYSDCFKTSAKIPFSERLLMVGMEVERLIQKWKPQGVAIETLFFKNNQKTAMHVAEVRGALLYIAGSHTLSVFEYTPAQIKMAIAGYGKGDKKQVIHMVEQLIYIEKEIKHDDEYDAIAVGLTHFAHSKQLSV